MLTSNRGADHPTVRQNNRAAIFRTLYQAAPITRGDIATHTGLSSKTVSIIMDELISHGLARELGRRESPGAGRKAVELEVPPSSRYAIGIDVAPPAVTAALVDLAGNIHQQVVDTATTETPPWNAETIVTSSARAAVALTSKLTPDRKDKIIGLGIGAPGRYKVEDEHYLGLRGAFVNGWVDIGSTDHLNRVFGYPVTIDNDANTSAIAEQWFGTGKNVSNFVLLNFSRAIGMGIVIDSEIYRGANRSAGEAAHLTVDVNAPRCVCGNNGCLDNFASPTSIMKTLRSRLANGEGSILTSVTEPTIAELLAAFNDDDPLAADVVTNAIGYLAAGLVSIINTYDPKMIMIGRALAIAGDRFFDQLRCEVRYRLSPSVRDTVNIEPASVHDAPVIGAATLALQEFFRAPIRKASAQAAH